MGLWIGGMTVYGVCIFVANVLLAARFHNHNWIGITCIILGCLAYIASYAFLSAVLNNEVDGLFVVNFRISLVWLTILFTVMFVYVCELGVRELFKLAEPDHDGPNTKNVVGIAQQDMKEDDATN